MKIFNEVILKHTKLVLMLVGAVIITFGLCISLQSLLAAYSAPLSNPAACDTNNPGCSAPLNLGATSNQAMSGSLKIINSTVATTPYGLLVQAGKSGLGTLTPLSLLDVNGGVAIGSYAGTAAAPSNGMIVSGNVGIGKNTAAYPLDVNGIVNATALYVGGAPLTASRWTLTGTSISYSTGNVGIGIASPAYKLDVQGGQINASGGLCMADTCVTSWAGVPTSWANMTGKPTTIAGYGITNAFYPGTARQTAIYGTCACSLVFCDGGNTYSCAPNGAGGFTAGSTCTCGCAYSGQWTAGTPCSGSLAGYLTN